MQNPNVFRHGNTHRGVRASRMLLLLGVFVVVPAAGVMTDSSIHSNVALNNIQTNARLVALAARVAPSWDEDFESLMRRLYKWWTCAIPNPGETSEEQMERMRECYARQGVPTPMSPGEIEELDKDIDDILRHTDDAPPTLSQAELAAFRAVLLEILLKIG